MKMIIFGANEVGAMIASQFYTANDITVIDNEKNKLDTFNKLDISFVDGNASNIEILKQANIKLQLNNIVCQEKDNDLIDKFVDTFEKNYHEYLEMIRDNLKSREVVNTRPDMMILQRELTVNLADTYSVIEEKYENDNLAVPLKSFFGNISKRNNIRRKEPSLIIYDRKIYNF